MVESTNGFVNAAKVAGKPETEARKISGISEVDII